MQVYDVSIRFMRRIQIREYEPAEAEVIVKAQLADGESPESAISEAFKLASGEVHVSLGLAKDTKLPTRAKGKETATATATPAPTPAPKAETKTSDKPRQAKAPAATDDIPDDTKTATTAKPTASTSDIPDDSAPATATAATETASDTTMTPAELSKWIGEQVRTGKLTSVAVAGLYPKFGISRFADLKPEKTGEAKAAIEELIAKNA